MELICTYVNAKGMASVQYLSHYKTDDDGFYLQGWSAVHQRPVTLISHRIVDTYESVELAEEALKSLNTSEDNNAGKSMPRIKSSIDTMDICFTGFKKADKETLFNLATENEMVIRKDVVKHLDILCYGYNAGPRKLEKALQQGVMILNRNQFENLIETGEVPEDV